MPIYKSLFGTDMIINRKILIKERLMKLYNILFDSFGPQHWWPGDSPFEVSVGAILTQNTNWQNVEKAIANLKKQRVLSPKSIYNLPHEKLAELIRPSGYYNVKAKRLKNFVSFIVDNHNGSLMNLKKYDIEDIRQQLLSIIGIGKETADSIMLYALDKPIFVIDTYTKRILSRHDIVHESADYDNCQSLFHQNIDPDISLYNEYHALFVKVGKYYCKPRANCDNCPLKGF
ncbi:MAG: endonuclease III domain-containing protein [Thermodesulfovibrionales bacterium]|nr:endonuclease III domain-containing protein [Thermodesulfovibrionales bacterium]